jgi:hypothetical protein
MDHFDGESVVQGHEFRLPEPIFEHLPPDHPLADFYRHRDPCRVSGDTDEPLPQIASGSSYR